MRAEALAMVLVAVGTASAVRGEVRVVDAAEARLRAAAGPDLSNPTRTYRGLPALHIGAAPLIRKVAGGIDASPFVTALPNQMWHGRVHSFGAATGIGFSATVVRAKAVDFGGLASEKHASGFLASELRYGIRMDEDDLFTVNLNSASQRMPALQTIGYRKSIHIRSIYLGASLIHEHRLAVSAGWYRLQVSDISAFDYAIERAVGMPAAGQGVRLGFDWRLAQAGAAAPARIGLECRDGDAGRDRDLAIGSGMSRERRVLVRFTEPF